MRRDIYRPLFVLISALVVAGAFGLLSQSAQNLSVANATVSIGSIDGPAVAVALGTTNGENGGKVASIPGRIGLVRLATTNGQFGFEVTNFIAFGTYTIEAASNFTGWTPVAIIYGPTNGLTVLDTNATGLRFFRVTEVLPAGYARTP